MNYKNIAYFTENRIPLSLDRLEYNRFYNKTDLFIAAVEAQNYGELYERLKRVLSSEISIKGSTDRYICFSVNKNNLKFKLKRTITALNN